MATIQPNTFVPTSISGCSLWLDAADSTTLTTAGSSVSQWRDKSANAYALTQATSVSQPTFSGNYIVFSSDRFLNIPQAAINNAATYSFFLIINPIASLNWIMAKQYDGVNTYNVLSMTNYSGLGGANTAGTSGYLYWHSYNQGTIVNSGTALSTSTVQMIELFYDGTSVSMVRNGTLMSLTTATAAIQNQTSANNFTLGVWSSGGTFFNGGTTNFQLGELVYYNTSLTTARQQQIEGYLAWKWGLQTSLPSTHPFRYLPPTSTGLAITLSAPLSLPSQSMSPSFSAFIFFRPTTITGCVLWLDANDPNGTGIQPANNATVSTWTDKSGIANNATGGSAQFQVNRQNALPGVYFGGGTSFGLSKPGSIPGGTTTSASFFAVFAGSGNDVGILAQAGAAGVACDKTGRLYYINTSGGAFYSTLYCGAAQVSTSYTLNTPFLLSDIYVNTGSGSYNHFAWSSGTSIGSAGVSGVNTGNATVRIGDNLVGSYFTGYMYELIMFAAALTDAQRQQVEGYLAWKWGLNGQLPASHPFKTTLPGLPIAIPGTRLMQQASFRPSQISGLQLWLDGQDPLNTGTAPGVGVTVGTWSDKSGNGKNATASGTPTYLSGGGISFNGTNAYYTNTSFAYNLSTRSMFIVIKVNTYLQFAGIFSLIPNPSTSNDWTTTTGLAPNTPNSSTLRVEGNSGQYTSDITATITNVNILNDNMNITSGSGFLNGTQATAITAGYTAGSASGYTIGVRWLSGAVATAYLLTGNIYEVILYSGPVTTGQRQSVEGYLAWKWNLVSNLPATHPYKKFPPPPN